MATLTIQRESWPIAGKFVISRGAKTEAEIVMVTVAQDGVIGRGECVPYRRYGETIESVMAQLESVKPVVEEAMDRRAVQALLPPGAARNAVDCAMWDWEAKKAGHPVWQLAGLPAPEAATTAYTISLDTPENMGAAAAKAAARPLLKLKLADRADLDRVRAVRHNAPAARLIVDANEGWDADTYQLLVPELEKLGVELIEQPFPAGDDAALINLPRPISICADESCHDRSNLALLRGRYDAINVKLDKTGGLTEAIELVKQARIDGFGIMIGCMVATSLAMAPAMLLTHAARWVDLDGPLLLAKDRDPGLRFDGSVIYPPARELWG